MRFCTRGELRRFARLSRPGFVGLIIVFALASGAPGTAMAAGTWTVAPGGAITATASDVTLSDTQTGTVVTCTSSDLAGTLKAGSGLSGSGIGSLTALTFSGCTLGPLDFTVTANALPWELTATSYNSGTGTSGMSISGIDLSVSTSGCQFTVDGTSAGADDGVVTGAYSNGTDTLTTSPSGGNLQTYDVSGCLGLTAQGDSWALSASYDVAPPQTITGLASPSISTSQQPASATVGSSIADKATVTGGNNPTGTVTFNLYNNSNGTGTPLFTDANEPLVNGTATSKGYTTTAAGTDYWVATYNGDSNNNPVSSGTADEPVTVSPAMPTTTDQCKNGGWQNYGSTFKNQGDCVSYVATGGKNQPSGG